MTEITTFVYDGNGVRVKKIAPDDSETYYVGGIYEVLSTTTGITKTSYYYAGAQRVAMRITAGVSTAVIYLHGDHLGSTSLTTDASGQVVARVLYYPYGEERYTVGTLTTDYGYTGQRKNGYLDTYSMGARDYDPRLGRWLSADTIVPDSANSQSLNRYSYVYNNPLKYTDPSGHRACSEWDENGQCLAWENDGYYSPLVRFVGDWTLEQRMAVGRGADAVAAEMYATVQADRQQAVYIAGIIGGDPSEYSSVSNLWDLSQDELFLAVYGGPVVFVAKLQCSTAGGGDCVDSDAWAWSRVGELGEVWVNENALADPSFTGYKLQMNTIHELGHGLDQRVGGKASSDLAAAMSADPRLTRKYGGFFGSFPWQQARSADAKRSGEVFADMYIGWAIGHWQTDPQAVDYQAGLAKARYMEANMLGLIALAVANN